MRTNSYVKNRFTSSIEPRKNFGIESSLTEKARINDGFGIEIEDSSFISERKVLQEVKLDEAAQHILNFTLFESLSFIDKKHLPLIRFYENSSFFTLSEYVISLLHAEYLDKKQDSSNFASLLEVLKLILTEKITLNDLRNYSRYILESAVFQCYELIKITHLSSPMSHCRLAVFTLKLSLTSFEFLALEENEKEQLHDLLGKIVFFINQELSNQQLLNDSTFHDLLKYYVYSLVYLSDQKKIDDNNLKLFIPKADYSLYYKAFKMETNHIPFLTYFFKRMHELDDNSLKKVALNGLEMLRNLEDVEREDIKLINNTFEFLSKKKN